MSSPSEDLPIIDLGAFNLGQALPSARGRQNKDVGLAKVRSLNGDDLAQLEAGIPKGIQTPAIQRIRAPHHRLAQLIAQGLPQREICAITGYSESRVSILKGDPTFRELIEYYRGQSEIVFIDMQKKLALLGETAVDMIAERLDSEDAETIPLSQLQSIMESALDRSVAPKKTAPGMGQSGNGNGQPAAPSIRIEFVAPKAAPALPTRPKASLLDNDGNEIELEELD